MTVIFIIAVTIAFASAVSKSKAKRIQREQAQLERERMEQNSAIIKEYYEKQARAMEQARQEAKQAYIAKLEQQLSVADAELSFNREQRDRLFRLLEIEQDQASACVEGSKEWAKHQRQIVTLESKIHTTQTRIDKAQLEKFNAEQELAAA